MSTKAIACIHFLTKLLVCLSSEKKVLIEAVFLVKSLVALREKKKKYNLGIIYFINLNLIYYVRFLVSTESLLPKTFNFSATLAVSELRHRGCLRFGSPCCGF